MIATTLVARLAFVTEQTVALVAGLPFVTELSVGIGSNALLQLFDFQVDILVLFHLVSPPPVVAFSQNTITAAWLRLKACLETSLGRRARARGLHYYHENPFALQARCPHRAGFQTGAKAPPEPARQRIGSRPPCGSAAAPSKWQARGSVGRAIRIRPGASHQRHGRRGSRWRRRSHTPVERFPGAWDGVDSSFRFGWQRFYSWLSNECAAGSSPRWRTPGAFWRPLSLPPPPPDGGGGRP